MLSAQSRIYRGDIIETDEKSKLKIEMNDRSTFILGPNTHLVIHYYKYEARLKGLIARISFTSGSLHTTTVRNTLAHKTRFELTTPLGIVGAQGAEFWSGFTFGQNRLDVVLLDGTKVYAKNSHGTVDITHAKHGTTIMGNSAPKAPESWPSRILTQALSTTQFIEI